MTDTAVVQLPVVEASQRAAVALELMRAQNVSGVLVRSGGRWRLYEAVDLVVAVADSGDVTLDDVAPARMIDGPDAAGGRVALQPAIGGRRAGGVFGLPGGGLAVAPDLLLRVSAGPRDCYCRVDRKPVKNGANGADCPDGHSKSVCCVPG